MSTRDFSGLRRGPSDVLVAACLWGTTGTVRTFVPGATNLSIAAVRIGLAGVILVGIAGGGRLRGLLSQGRNLGPLALGALAMTTYQTAFFSAAARTGVAVGTVVTIGSAPAFAGVLGLVTRRARPSRRWLVATCGAVAGSAAIVSGGGGEAGADPVGIALALLSGLAYAVYATLVSGLVARGEDDRAVAASMFGAAGVLVAPVLVSGEAAWMLTGRGAVLGFYLGVVATAGGYLLFARGLRTVAATTATTLTLAEPAIAAVLGVAVLQEHLTAPALAGLALVAASLALLASATDPDRSGAG